MTIAPSVLMAALADRYTIIRELGRGGMATVYLAHDLKHDRDVAIKVLHEELTVSLGKERFLREITIAAGLTHPHILPLHDSGEAAGRLFYVMPYVDGPSLRQQLLRAGELPIADAVRILRDVADAMAHAHKRGVVHRDLKPENVMLTERHALVTDFGVAKALSEATGRHTLTTAGVALGTPTYMSPEQATADPATDHRSDIYAFGVLAYELLTGRPPFTGTSPQAVLAAHVTTAVTPVTQHRASIPPTLAELVMRCLEKKPADRPQSAADLLPLLEALLTPSGGITPHQTAPYAATSRTTRGRNMWMLVGAAVVVVAVTAFAMYTIRGGMSHATEDGAGASGNVWLAVLPPENQGRPEDEWFADGLADEIRGALARVPGAQVKASRSSQMFKGTSKSIAEIARELGVSYVVTGKVRWEPTEKGSGRVIVATELLDARTEAVKGRALVDTTLTDVNRGQVAVAERTARELAALLALAPPLSFSAAQPRPKVRPDAYAIYLAGREAFGRFTRESLRRSIEHFTRAIELDSTFAKAYAWRAFAALSVATGDYVVDRESEAALRRAVALAPDDADVLVARGLRRRIDWDWQGARADLNRALEHDPNNPWALWGLSDLEIALGNPDRGVELGRRAAEVDPLMAGDIYPLSLWKVGRLDESLAASRAGLAVDSLSTSNCWWCQIAYVLALRGDVDGTRAAESKAVALGRGRLHLDVPALATAGRMQEARERLRQLLSAYDRKEVGAFKVARGYASLGDTDSAFVWLDRLVEARSAGAFEVANNPFLSSLRSDPRYASLMRRIGIPMESERRMP